MSNCFCGLVTITGKKSDVIAFTQDALTEVSGGFKHIKGTRGGYVCGEGIQGFLEDGTYEANFSVEFAWNVIPEQIRVLSSQYPLTFEVTGSETEINFAQRVCAKDGVLLINEETDLDTKKVLNLL